MQPKKPQDAVQFTFESAQRIAGVVRAAENAAPEGVPLSFRRMFTDRHPKQVRAAVYTGPWAVGQTSAVSYKYAKTGTVAVTNLLWPITSSRSDDCMIGKEGTAWFLIAPRLETVAITTSTVSIPYATGYSETPVVSGISLSAVLDTNSCAITIGSTLSTTMIRIASATSTIRVVSGTATSAFLRVRA